MQSSGASTILESKSIVLVIELTVYLDFIAPIDSTAVKKLRDAGAIIVG